MTLLRSISSIALGWVTLLVACHGVWAEPVVTNARAERRTDGSGKVDIRYDLAGGLGAARVDVAFADESGDDWTTIPTPGTLSGDAGNDVSDGTGRHMVWDADGDPRQGNRPWTRVRVRAALLRQTAVYTLPGGVPLEMVRIPAGAFRIGSPSDPPYTQHNEGPARRIIIDYAFEIGKYPITQAQWRAVMQGFPADLTAGEADEKPMHNVSWNDTQDFLDRLNELGLGTFRLPSESEWEYACRAGTQTRWHFGDDPEKLEKYAWFRGNNSPRGVKPVGQLLPNAFGLYDMHGNVMEWVQDVYNLNYSAHPTDGSPYFEHPDRRGRVLRSAAYGWPVEATRSAARLSNGRKPRWDYYGLRVVREP